MSKKRRRNLNKSNANEFVEVDVDNFEEAADFEEAEFDDDFDALVDEISEEKEEKFDIGKFFADNWPKLVAAGVVVAGGIVAMICGINRNREETAKLETGDIPEVTDITDVGDIEVVEF